MLEAITKTLIFSLIELLGVIALSIYYPKIALGLYLVLTGLIIFTLFKFKKTIKLEYLDPGSPMHTVKVSSSIKLVLIALLWPLCYIKVIYTVFLVLLRLH
jgi:hypothetical protein